jgi:hopene-associated glycosyltransferase HpnB
MQAGRHPGAGTPAGSVIRSRLCQAVRVIAVVAAAGLAAVAWAYLLVCHGMFWRTDQRLPALSRSSEPASWPSVTAVIPARNEAAVLPTSLPSLLRQDYPGPLSIVLVDDESTDGTAEVAAELGRAAGWAVRPAADHVTAGAHGPGLAPAAPGAGPGPAERAGRQLRVVAGQPLPPGWAGKVWAMSQGVAAAGDTDYLLFTDADIAYAADAVTGLVRSAADEQRGLVSQMALLRADTGWERVLVPAFVYFFAQLYPFRRVNGTGRTAAAAGGCMLVRREVLAAAGGLAEISGARIDDVALGRLLKRAGARTWLGLTTAVTSTRPYDRLADLWNMVARSAYTQLRYSPAAVIGTVLGLAWLYLLPPAAGLAGLAWGAAGGGSTAWWLAAAGLAGWALMSVSYLPMLRLYRLSPLRAPGLPLIAAMYAAMTADSARRHHAGRGGEWKGRVIEPGTQQPAPHQ